MTRRKRLAQATPPSGSRPGYPTINAGPAKTRLLLRADQNRLVRFDLDFLFVSVAAAHRDHLDRVLSGAQQQTLHRVVELSGVAHELAVEIYRLELVRRGDAQASKRRFCEWESLHRLSKFRGLARRGKNPQNALKPA